MTTRINRKELLKLYPPAEGWEHLDCTLVSPLTFEEEQRLASLIISGIYSTPLEWAYSHQGRRLVIVCRRA